MCGYFAARSALRRLARLNVELKIDDGAAGWPDHAPFDAILAAAAAAEIPPALTAQLRPGGRMVIPVGASFMVQQLMLVVKNLDGTISSRQILPVNFVPLTGQR
jgi:protein-L-isoaspartate(D-aspartate) O-methyltransferase